MHFQLILVFFVLKQPSERWAGAFDKTKLHPNRHHFALQKGDYVVPGLGTHRLPQSPVLFWCSGAGCGIIDPTKDLAVFFCCAVFFLPLQFFYLGCTYTPHSFSNSPGNVHDVTP